MRIRKVETLKGDYRLTFAGNYRIALFGITPRKMTWHSLESGDTFDCTKKGLPPLKVEWEILSKGAAADLTEKLAASVSPKDQFETTVDYQRRVKASVASALGDKANVDMWFLIGEPPGLRYDADEGAITTVSIFRVNLRDEEKVRSIYDASNAFGASIKVTKRDIKRTILDPSGGAAFLKLPIKAEIAKAQWPDIRVALQGALRDPPIEVERDWTTQPKFDNPYEDDVTSNKLKVRPKRLIVYNERTKEILFDLDLERNGHGGR